MATTIISSTTVTSATGHATQAHAIYAVNSARWWVFYIKSTTVIGSAYSSDGTTWTAGPDITPGHASNTIVQDGREFSVAYANIAATDVVYLTYVDSAAATQFGQGNGYFYCRCRISGTSITKDSDTQAAFGAETGDQPWGQTLAFDSGHHLWLMGPDWGDPSFSKSSSADTGGASGVTIGAEERFYTDAANVGHSTKLIPLASGNSMLVTADDTTNSPDGSADDIWWGIGTDPTSTNPSTIFGTSVAVNVNDWNVVRRTDTDFHAIRRTGANTYAHRRFNGTTWSAGDTISTQASVAGAGVALVSDGTNVWLLVVDSATGNHVQVCEWTSGTGWGSWTALESSSATRTFLSVSAQADGSGNWLILWTDGTGSPWAIKGTLLATGGGGGGPTPITVPTDAGTGAQTLTLATLAVNVTDSATGAQTPAVLVQIPLSADTATGSQTLALGTVTLAIGDAGSGATNTPAISATLAPPADTATGGQSASVAATLAPPTDTATGGQTPALGTISPSVTESASGGESVNVSGSAQPGVSDSGSGNEGVGLGTIAPSVPIETATGTDGTSLGTITPSVPVESASGGDSASLGTISPAVVDAAVGHEQLVLATLTVPLSDAALAAEQLVITATIPLADTASGSESATNGAPGSVSVLDAATGAEQLALGALSLAVADAATGVTLQQVTAALTITDQATAAAQIALGAFNPAVADTGVGADGAPTLAPIAPALTESGAGSETASLGPISPTLDDTGVASDAGSPNVVIAVAPSDSASGAESIAPPGIFVPLADPGLGADAVTGILITVIIDNVLSQADAAAAREALAVLAVATALSGIWVGPGFTTAHFQPLEVAVMAQRPIIAETRRG